MKRKVDPWISLCTLTHTRALKCIFSIPLSFLPFPISFVYSWTVYSTLCWQISVICKYFKNKPRRVSTGNDWHRRETKKVFFFFFLSLFLSDWFRVVIFLPTSTLSSRWVFFNYLFALCITFNRIEPVHKSNLQRKKDTRRSSLAYTCRHLNHFLCWRRFVISLTCFHQLQATDIKKKKKKEKKKNQLRRPFVWL